MRHGSGRTRAAQTLVVRTGERHCSRAISGWSTRRGTRLAPRSLCRRMPPGFPPVTWSAPGSYWPSPPSAQTVKRCWNPLTDHVVRILPGADVLASRGNLVAWTTGKACLPQCAVHFTDVQTGMARTLRLPSEATGTGHGAFSPDGSTFALPVGIGGRPGVHPAAVAVMDLRTQVVRLLPGTEQAPGPSRAPQIAFWSSTGWLFVAEVGGTHVLSWRPGDQGATVLSKVRLPSIALNPPQFQSEYPNLFAA